MQDLVGSQKLCRSPYGLGGVKASGYFSAMTTSGHGGTVSAGNNPDLCGQSLSRVSDFVFDLLLFDNTKAITTSLLWST